MELRLDRLTADIVRGAVGVCVLLAVLSWFRGESLGQSALIGISLAVAAVPEGLPAVVTVTLAIGVRQMARRQAIVRRLQAVETLGSTTVICTDKTGTLTENRLAVTAVVPAQDGAGADAAPARRAVIAAALRASENRAGGVLNDPIEDAIVTAARSEELALANDESREAIVEVVPFDPLRKRASVIVGDPAGGRAIYVKGAPETVISLLADGPARSALRHEAEGLARGGARVLLVAQRDGVTGPIEAEERELEAVGLLAFSDTPRATARDSVAAARRAGIRTIMVTGDHPRTAQAVAELTGIVPADRSPSIATGADLDRLSDAELGRISADVDVFARVVPIHKLRLVQALRRGGQVVAMTGDGVNDVPALRAADIGVAMGSRGSDAAIEAADLVLADDDYTTIVAAVARGRTIYRNIRHFSHYLLAANTGEVLVFAAAIAAGVGAPLTVVQILLVNLLTDGLPAAALASDPPERQVMQQRPRPRTEPLLAGLGSQILLVGFATGAAALGSYLIGYQLSTATGRTMAFTTLVASQLVYVFSARTEARPWQAAGNRLLLAAVAISGAVAAAILAIPGLRAAFDVVGLSGGRLALALLLGVLPTLVAEVLKSRAIITRR